MAHRGGDSDGFRGLRGIRPGCGAALSIEWCITRRRGGADGSQPAPYLGRVASRTTRSGNHARGNFARSGWHATETLGGTDCRDPCPAWIRGDPVRRGTGDRGTRDRGGGSGRHHTVLGLLVLGVTAVPLNRVHEALESSRTSIKSLVEQAPDGVFVADLDGRYTDVNEAGCRMLGYARAEILGKTIVDLIPPGEVSGCGRKEKTSRGAIRRRSGHFVARTAATSLSR